MGILGFFLGVLTSIMVYWLFIKEKSQEKWYTCVLAIIFISWTIFSVDFVVTTVIEGILQAAVVAGVLFGIVEIVLFIFMKRFSNLSLIPKAKASI